MREREPSGLLWCRLLHHRPIERRVVGCATDVADCLWFAQHPCRTGKGVELLALRLRWQQQQKYQIDRPATGVTISPPAITAKQGAARYAKY
jgi:hypothetical protein